MYYANYICIHYYYIKKESFNGKILVEYWLEAIFEHVLSILATPGTKVSLINM